MGRPQHQAKVVPHSGIAWRQRNRLLQRSLRLRKLLQIQQRNAVVQRSLRERLILRKSLRKRSLRALGLLLVHPRHAVVVKPNGLRTVIGCSYSHRRSADSERKKNQCLKQSRGTSSHFQTSRQTERRKHACTIEATVSQILPIPCIRECADGSNPLWSC